MALVYGSHSVPILLIAAHQVVSIPPQIVNGFLASICMCSLAKGRDGIRSHRPDTSLSTQSLLGSAASLS